jgi:hypothetical protein
VWKEKRERGRGEVREGRKSKKKKKHVGPPSSINKKK